jgi:hypothetical protein
MLWLAHDDILRRMRTLLTLAIVPLLAASLCARRSERWGMYEATFAGPSNGNPFVEVTFGAEFRFQNRTNQRAEGF